MEEAAGSIINDVLEVGQLYLTSRNAGMDAKIPERSFATILSYIIDMIFNIVTKVESAVV